MCKNIPFPINYRRTSKLNILSGVSDKSSNTLQIHWKFSFFFFPLLLPFEHALELIKSFPAESRAYSLPYYARHFRCPIL